MIRISWIIWRIVFDQFDQFEFDFSMGVIFINSVNEVRYNAGRLKRLDTCSAILLFMELNFTHLHGMIENLFGY